MPYVGMCARRLCLNGCRHEAACIRAGPRGMPHRYAHGLNPETVEDSAFMEELALGHAEAYGQPLIPVQEETFDTDAQHRDRTMPNRPLNHAVHMQRAYLHILVTHTPTSIWLRLDHCCRTGERLRRDLDKCGGHIHIGSFAQHHVWASSPVRCIGLMMQLWAPHLARCMWGGTRLDDWPHMTYKSARHVCRIVYQYICMQQPDLDGDDTR